MHSDILEEEISTLADDYFKEDHYIKYTDLEELFDERSAVAAALRHPDHDGCRQPPGLIRSRPPERDFRGSFPFLDSTQQIAQNANTTALNSLSH
jgi:hypothetical protein